MSTPPPPPPSHYAAATSAHQATVSDAAVRVSRRNAWLGALSVLVVGVVGGLVLLILAGTRYDDAVQSLARAPIGCVTTLNFSKAGTFTVYIETKGSIGALEGDCPNGNRGYEYSGSRLPNVDVVVNDPSGGAVALVRDRSRSYDAGGAVGQSISSMTIQTTGSYTITATSQEANVVVAVGKNPQSASGSMAVGGYIAIGAGVIVGGLTLALGLRRASHRGGSERGSQPGAWDGSAGASGRSSSNMPPAQGPSGFSPPPFDAPTATMPTYRPPPPPPPSAGPWTA